MSDIFLSYASEDRERVRPLAKALADEGWSVFWDRVIPVGKTWHEMLEKELSAARSLLVVWSENSIKSKWVREEANEGIRIELPLFPVLLDALLPPLGFRGIQSADLSTWDGSPTSPVFQNLARDIKKTLGPPATPEPVEPIPSEPAPPEPKPPEVTKGRLWVDTEPKEATVKFLNTQTEFSQGMQLESGRYEVEVSAEGYETKKEWVELVPGEEKRLDVALTKIKAHLRVETEPRDAAVKIVNLEAEFFQGMALEPGRYEVEVSAEGYETKKEWIELSPGEEKRISIVLTKLKAHLWVETEPRDAAVKILNLEVEFTQGMALEPGRYELEVSADGYGTQNEWVELNPGEEKHHIISLTELKAHLRVETEPRDARVRILNFQAEFTQGMALEPGRYEVEVSADGHETKREWLELGAGEDRHISLRLSPVIAPEIVEEVKPEIREPEPAEPEPPKPKVAEPEPVKPRPAEPPKPKTLEQMRKSRALLIGIPAGLALLLLMVGLVWFFSERQPAKIATPERQAKERAPLERQPDKIPPLKTPLKTFTNSLGMKFVLIPAGTFQMGSPKGEAGRDDDERQHRVTISKPFYLQYTEVTQGQWQKVMGNNPSKFKKCGKNCPVEMVSWNDAQEFIKKLNRMEKTDKYRLPTEAEWEYACRAGSTNAWCFGDDEAKLKEYGWYDKNSQDKTQPVGQLKPNAWGLYDMHGNVLEWCQDWYGKYPKGPVKDPTGPADGKYRVLRGGSWLDLAGFMRSAFRDDLNPGVRNDYFLGFRVARAR